MSRATRTLCKTLDLVAANNEAGTVTVMRAAERLGDEVLRQQLLNLIQRMNQDAAQLRLARGEIAGQGLQRA